MTDAVIDQRPNQVRGLIWADRLAICLWLIFGGLLGLVYAAWGVPGAFVAFQKVVGVVCAFIWFAGRSIDWTFTGRVR